MTVDAARRGSAGPPLRAAFRLGWLAAVLYTVYQELGTHPTHPPLVGMLLTLGAAVGWLGLVLVSIAGMGMVGAI